MNCIKCIFLRANNFRSIIIASLILLFSLTISAQTADIPKGSIIIDMGVFPQTVGNALKPYGLVYELLDVNKVPVLWSINKTKFRNGVDFTVDGLDFRGGPFIIHKDYTQNQSVINSLANWEAQGVVTYTTLTDVTVDLHKELTTFPNWVMDLDNGAIGIEYMENAGIPATAYRQDTPLNLNGCDDLFILPHADPTWATHGILYDWNNTRANGGNEGWFWAACHAVSVLEGIENPSDPTQRLNFLSSDPVPGLIDFNAHDDGSGGPYTYDNPSDSFMQFLGPIDAATENGSEQVYLPSPGGSWRPTTTVSVWDENQADLLAGNTPGKAAKVAYGFGFGDPDRGKIMYEGGHSHNKGSVDDVAAQRVMLNFSFDAPAGKTPIIVNNLPVSGAIEGGESISFDASADSPISGSNITYLWSFDGGGGSFDDVNIPNPTFSTSPVTSVENLIITLIVSDPCGRETFLSFPLAVNPPPVAPVANDDNYSTYNTTSFVFNALDNDTDDNNNIDTATFNPTSALTVAGGTFSSNGNGFLNFEPTPGYVGTAQLTYEICDTTALCDTATITVTVESSGCGVNEKLIGSPAYATTVTSGNFKNDTRALGAPNGNFAEADKDGRTMVLDFGAGVSPRVGSVIKFYILSKDGGTYNGTINADNQLLLFPFPAATEIAVSTSALASNPDIVEFTVTEVGTRYVEITGIDQDFSVDAVEYELETCTPYVSPVTQDDLSEDNIVGSAVPVYLLANDSDADGTIDRSSINVIVPANATDVVNDVHGHAIGFTVANEGVWLLDQKLGIINFTPRAWFLTNPTPIQYRVNDNDANTSNISTITITYNLMDTDGDGVPNGYDLDDDNDGILDTNEGFCLAPEQSGTWGGSGTEVVYNFDNGVIARISNNATPGFTANGNFNAAGNNFWSETLEGDVSIEGQYQWGSTVTVNFEDGYGNPLVIVNPILHIDRLGEINAGSGEQYSAEITLVGGATWTRLTGTDDFLATPTTVRDAGAGSLADPLYTSESTLDDSDGSAAGSLQIKGRISSFQLQISQAGNFGTADIMEMILFACNYVDSDEDGIHDHMDPDSDNDGCTDADEAYYGLEPDADGDNNGFYGTGTPTVDSRGLVVGASYTGTNNIYTNTIQNSCDDVDGDGVPDVGDLDNDNDGILDEDETRTVANFQPSCAGTVLSFINYTEETGDGNASTFLVDEVFRFSDVAVGYDALVTIVQTFHAAVVDLDDNATDIGSFKPITRFTLPHVGHEGFVEYRIDFVQAGTSTPAGLAEFFVNYNDIDGDGSGEFSEINATTFPVSYTLNTPTSLTMENKDLLYATGQAAVFNGSGNGFPESNFSARYTNRNSLTLRLGGVAIVKNATSTGRLHNIEFNCVSNYINPSTIITDADGDGIPNKFDTDSDNDGCVDALEGDGGFTLAQVAGDGSLGNAVDTNGVPSIATGGQANLSAYDASVTGDQCDDDGDGIINLNDICDGFDDTADADADGVPDGCDLDDDNDGILDSVECPGELYYNDSFEVPDIQILGVDTVGGRPDADNDGEVDALLAQNSIEGWTLTDTNNFDIVFDIFNASAGTQSLDLYGTPSATGIEKTFLGFTEGVPVNFSLDYSSVESLFEAEVSVDYGTGPILLTTLKPNNIAAVDSPGVVGARASSIVWNTFTINLLPTASGTVKIIIQSTSLGVGQTGVLIDNVILSQPSCSDYDNDSIPDYLDIDSDNDGCNDAIEAGHIDANNDGEVDGTGYDVEGKVAGAVTAYTGLTPAVTKAVQTTVTPPVADETVQQGDNATFTASAAALEASSFTAGTPNYDTNADAGLSFQWFENDVLMPGETANSVTLTAVTLAMHSNVYKVVISHTGNACPVEDEGVLYVQDPSIESVKTVVLTDDGNGVDGANDVLTYTILVTNTGNTELSNVNIIDTLLDANATPLTLTSGPTFVGPSNLGSVEGTLLVDEIATYTATYTLTQNDANVGGVSNSVTASGDTSIAINVTDVSDDNDDADGNVLDDPTETIIVANPELITTKTITTFGRVLNDVIEYDIIVFNSGNVTITNIDVTDANANLGSIVGSPIATLAPGETAIVTASQTITQTDLNAKFIENSASVLGDSPNGVDDVSDVSDTDVDGNGSAIPNNETIESPNGNGTTDADATNDPTVTYFNGVPLAQDDAITVNEDSGLTIINVLLDNGSGADTFGLDGPNTGAISIPSATSANGGAVSVNNNGTPTDPTDDTISYTPTANFNGTDTIDYTITDANGDTSSATVTITVNPINDAPVALNDLATTVTEDAVTIPVLTNDSDVDGDVLTISGITVPPTQGTVVINGDGTITFTPNVTFVAGSDTFQYEVCDGSGLCDTASVTVTVPKTPLPPTANSDSKSFPEDTTLTVNAATGLLSNDTDPNADETLTVSQFVVNSITYTPGTTVNLAEGDLTINADGSYVFVPTPNYFGAIPQVVYTISDGNAGTASSTLDLFVVSQNDLPTALDDAATVNEDSGATIIDVLADNGNGVDSFGGDGPNGGAITLPSPVSANGGTVTVNNNGTPTDPTDDTVSYTPALDFNGVDTFTYTITDANGDTSTATVTVTVTAVNDLPTAVNDAVTVNEDSGANIINVLADNGSGADSFGGDGPNSGAIILPSATSVEGGTVTVNDNGTTDPTDDTVNYTPALDFNGVDTFTYTITDANNDTSTATVTVTVNPVNDLPTALDDAATVNEDSGATIINVLADNGNGADSFGGDGPNSGAIILPSATSVNGGTVTVNNNGTPTDPTDDTVSYTPALDFNGIDTFTYTITDSNNDTSTATVTVTVNPVNDLPTALDDAATVNEDSGATIINVLADNGNGVDSFGGDGPNSGAITLPSATSVAGGTVTVNDNGTPTDPTDDTVSYTPALDFNGVDTFTYTITDSNNDTSTATVTVTVNAVNDVPLAKNDVVTVVEDSSANIINVLADNGNGADSFGGDGPNSGAITLPTGTTTKGGTVTVNDNGTPADPTDDTVIYTPVSDFNGQDTFTYTITDSNSDTSTATVTVTVSAVNDLPIAVDDAVTINEDSGATIINVLADNGNGVDSFGGDGPNSGAITLPSATSVNGGTVTVNNNGTPTDPTDDSVSYTPALNFNGVDTFTYTISDVNGDRSTATVTVTVNSVNDVPVAVDDSYTVNKNVSVQLLPLTADSDADGDTISMVSINGIALTPGIAQSIAVTNGTVTTDTGGIITFTPDTNYSGSVSFPYVITDGTATATANEIITINPTNDAPIAVDDTYTTNEDTAVQLVPLTGDTDVDGDTLSIVSINGTALTPGTAQTIAVTNGSVSINTAGVITFTPAANYNGSVSFPYVITDGTETATANENITVNAINDAPVAVNDAYTTDEDTNIQLLPLTGDSDVDGDTLSIVSINGTALTPGTAQTIAVTNGSVDITIGGVITFIPNTNYNGAVSFPYVITDGTVNATANETITITPVNDTPVAVDDLSTTNPGVAVTIPVLTNDTDVDGDVLTVSSIVTVPVNGTVVINGDGTITYTPNPGFEFGSDTFEYEVCDGSGLCDIALVTVEVPKSFLPPTANPDAKSTLENTTLTVAAATGLLSNDTDPNSDETLVVTTFEIGGTTYTAGTTVNLTEGDLTINTDGSYEFVPAFNYNGAVPQVTYSISDGNGGTSSSTLDITVTLVNETPVAVDDAYTTDEDTSVQLLPLTDDTDGDGDTLSIVSINGITLTPGTAQSIAVTNGTVTIDIPGIITFIPDANYNGAVSFPYVITDGTATATANENITVTSINDVPVAVDDAYTTDEDTSVQLLPLTADSDGEGDTLSIVSINGITLTPGTAQTIAVTNGTVTTDTAGIITFTPATNYIGGVSFPYVITDGTDTATANEIITITPVNDAPIAVDDTYTIDEDTSVQLLPLTADTDADGDTLSIVSINGTTLTPGTAQTITVTNGTVTTDTAGIITFTPAVNYNGSVSFPYVITDGTDTATANENISITPVNDAPVAVNDLSTTNPGVAVTIPVLSNDTDVDGDALTVSSIVTPPVNGTVVINGNGTITYTPNAGFNVGSDTFEYQVCDGSGLCDIALVRVDVPKSFVPPTANPDSKSTLENTTLTVAAATGLLSNDTDPNADETLVVTNFVIGGISYSVGVTQNLTEGALTINSDGSYEFVPALNYNGAVPQVTYNISDGNGGTSSSTLDITVTLVNDTPVAVDDAYTTDEDTSIQILPLTGDTDGDDDTLSIVSINGITLTPGTAQTITVTNGKVTVNTAGIIVFTPAADYNGGVSFPYVITDGTATATANENVTVNAVNDTPIAVDDAYTTDEDTAVQLLPLTADTDPDGDTLSIASINGTALTPGTAQSIAVTNGTVDIDIAGVITFTPAANYNGAVSFPYVITDGIDTATANENITVTAINDAPVAVDDTYTTDEDTSVQLLPLTGDTDLDGDTLNIVSINGTTLTPGTAQSIAVTNGTVDIDIAGVITFTP
ncbi:Ig-like domain-containing protein, partial [Mariniflexile sp. AS56]|uniref:Ig-like domain-containing protein n=1 Tax=Mariniflexile sp. AS56 TaxID=3063957 RepID=UPI0026F19D4C